LEEEIETIQLLNDNLKEETKELENKKDLVGLIVLILRTFYLIGE
jgi:hypothetical protein